MRTTGHITLAAIVAASVFGSVTCGYGSPPPAEPSEGGAAELLRWLVEVANRPEEPGTYTYSCPHGGEVEVTVTTGEEQEDKLSGKWEIEIDECGPGGDPGGMHPGHIYGLPTVSNGHFAFASETVFLESGRRRFEAAVEADFDWRWDRRHDSSGRLYSCDREWTDISGVFEAGLDEPYTGLLEGIVCGGTVKIFVSDFPGSDARADAGS